MRRTPRSLIAVAIAMLLLAMPALRASASVAVLVEEPYGEMGKFNPAGHSALYFDHICAASPTKLRVCGPGEMGSVISRYDGISNHDWLAMPLLGYLYSVDNSADIPTTMDKATELKLRDAYRRAHLLSVAPNLPDGGTPEGNWYELVGSALDRTIYGFQVKTTAEQDAHLIAVLNDRRNVQRYNGFLRNCADFDRVIVNRFYPFAIKRNFIADAGITTPKQAGRALTKYGKNHPEAEFSTFIVHQVPGSLGRSHTIKGVAQSLLTSKKYVAPITFLEPVVTGVIFIAYMGDGRFSMPVDAPELPVRQMALVQEAAARSKEVPVQNTDPGGRLPVMPWSSPTEQLSLGDASAALLSPTL